MSGNIGSSEWFTTSADKVLETALSVIQTKLQGVQGTGGTTNNETSMQTRATSYLPYVIGAVVLGAIVLILVKR